MFFTDWEGPWILTDFALELTMAVFNNERFFSNLSLYDDYLAYKEKRKNYEAGYTLKLLVPFLLAAGITDRDVNEIAMNTARFVPDADRAMARLQKKWKPVVISTSYTQYLEKTASIIGVNGFLHGTEIEFDSLHLPHSLEKKLLDMVDEIASLKGENLYRKLDEIFSIKEIMEILESVKAVGAGEKAKILREYCESNNVEFPIAIGDSISDYKMLNEAKKLGGVAIAFNGNEYALKHADIAIISSTAYSEAIVIELFMKYGEKAYQYLDDAEKELENTEIHIIEEHNFREVLEKSKRMRVKLRGLAGELG